MHTTENLCVAMSNYVPRYERIISEKQEQKVSRFESNEQ